MASSFRLVIRSGVDVGKEYPLEKNELIVGREQSNDITISDPEVSRRHSRLFYQNGSYVVEDLGSTNGTFVNGQRLTGPYILRPGEMLNFGEHVSVLFEATQIDPNATVVAGSPRPVAQKQPIYAPAPSQPVPYSPPAGGSQSAVVNAAPAQQPYEQEFEERQAVAPKGGKKTGLKLPKWATIIVIVVLILLVLCILPVTIIDVTNQWCNLFGTIFNGITPGACP